MAIRYLEQEPETEKKPKIRYIDEPSILEKAGDVLLGSKKSGSEAAMVPSFPAAPPIPGRGLAPLPAPAAAPAVQPAPAAPPKTARDFYKLAFSALESGDKGAAAKMAAESLRLDPNFKESSNLIERVSGKNLAQTAGPGDHKAQEAFKASLAKFQESVAAFKNGDRVGALSAARGALAAYPGMVEARKMIERLSANPKAGAEPMRTPEGDAKLLGRERAEPISLLRQAFPVQDVVSDIDKSVPVRSLAAGTARLGGSMAGIPNLAYNLAALPANAVAEAIGREDLIAKDPQLFKRQVEWWDGLASKYSVVSQEFREKGDSFFSVVKRKDPTEIAKYIAAMAFESAPNTVATIGLTLAGQPNAGLALMGALSASQEMTETADSKAGQSAKTVNALVNGILEAAFERTPGLLGKWQKAMGALDGATKGQVLKSVGKMLVSTVVQEGPGEEGLTTLTQDLAKVGTGIQGPEYLKGTPERMAEASAAGAAAGLLTGGAGAAPLITAPVASGLNVVQAPPSPPAAPGQGTGKLDFDALMQEIEKMRGEIDAPPPPPAPRTAPPADVAAPAQKRFRIPRAEIEARVDALQNDAMNERNDKVTPLEKFIRDNGGMRSNSDKREEFESVPIYLRGIYPADEMRQMAVEQGIPNVPDDLEHWARGLKNRGKVPSRSSFYDQARREIENEYETYGPPSQRERFTGPENDEPVPFERGGRYDVGQGDLFNNQPELSISSKTGREIMNQVEALTPASHGEDAGGDIRDFGEKIGGARKDMARPLGPRAAITQDDRPGWVKKYVPMQNKTTGKWSLAIADGRGRSRMIVSGDIGSFGSAEEAMAAAPLAEVSRTHRVEQDRVTGKFEITRQVREGRRGVKVKGDFASRDEAMRYMAGHAQELIETKFKFPERPWLDNIQRTGPERRKGNVTPKMFQEAFDFRGGEFGNWNMGGDGQAVLNYAYDALHDLAEFVGVDPKAISLNGELSIAFGARGKGGKQSAAAHYERDYGVINLTKIRGAGSLAHEWFHALDHYLGRADRGMEPKRASSGQYEQTGDMLSKGFSYKSQTREALRAAFKNVMDKIQWKEESRAISAEPLTKGQKHYIDGLRYRLTDLRRSLDGDLAKYNRTKSGATATQLAKWDDLATRLLSGDYGEKISIPPSEQSSRNNKYAMGRSSFRVLEDMNGLYKSVTGRSFDKTEPGSVGRDIYYTILNLDALKSRLARARSGESETVKSRTDYFKWATDIDSFRSSDYWSTPHELGARAFESFVLDKATKGNRESQYLVYGPENKFYEDSGMKPYPAGDERISIGNAFQSLFDVIEQVKTDRGVALRETGADYAALPPVNGYEAKAAELEKQGKGTDPEAARELGAQYDAQGAPVFYSQIQRTLSEKMPNAAPVAMVRNLIDPAKGNVKAEEVEWSGIEEFLAGKEKVTKAELLDFLKANEVQVKEVVKSSGVSLVARPDVKNEGRWEVYDPIADKTIARGFESQPEAEGIIPKIGGTPGALPQTKFQNYQLPGGENYREILLTLPSQKPTDYKSLLSQRGWSVKQLESGDYVVVDGAGEWVTSEKGSPETAARYALRVTQSADIGMDFKSPHFDEPNILAHVRMNDRTTADGKRVLFLEEVQSDWHQRGRDQGYAAQGKTKDVGQLAGIEKDGYWEIVNNEGQFITNVYFSEAKTKNEAIAEARRRLANEPSRTDMRLPGVPNAPFKKTWHEMALKRMLRYAVDNGYDGIAWTTGEQQAERYNLSKQIDGVRWNEKTEILQAWRGNENVIEQYNVKADKLADFVGKDVARNLIETKPGRTGFRIVTGDGLKVGGEGMKGFYDQIVPSFLNKYTKKWGGRVGEAYLSQTKETKLLANDNATNAAAIGASPVHSLDITPSMRESVAQGQALFEKGPNYAALPAVKQMDLFGPAGEAMHQVKVDVPKVLQESVVVKKLQADRFLDAYSLTVESPEDTAAIFSFMQNNDYESMYVIGMDDSGRILGSNLVGVGTIDSVTLNPRDIFKAVDAMGATRFAIVHNHPSHDPTPSQDDLRLTSRVHRMAKRHGARLLHHIVINDTRFSTIDADGGGSQFSAYSKRTAVGKVPVFQTAQSWTVGTPGPLVNSPEAAATFLKGVQRPTDGVVLLVMSTKNRVNAVWHLSSDLPKDPYDIARAAAKMAVRHAGRSIILASGGDVVPTSGYIGQISEVLRDWQINFLDWIGSPRALDGAVYSARTKGHLGETAGQYVSGRETLRDPSGSYDDPYMENRAMAAKRGEFLTHNIDDIVRSAKDVIEGIMTPITTELKNMDPSLKIALRRNVFNEKKNTHNDLHAALPLIRKASRMSREDQADLDLAGKNGDVARIGDIVARNGLTAEYAAYRKAMDALRERAIAAGVDMGYLQQYFPRIVQDRAGFLEHIKKDARWPEIAALLARAEQEGTVTEQDKVAIINNYLRGYAHATINIHTPGNVKTREIDKIGPLKNQFYMDWRKAVVRYIEGMNKMVADREFFGKSARLKNEGATLFGSAPKELDIEKSVGQYVKDIFNEGRAKNFDEVKLKSILEAYFNQRLPSLAVRIYRDITTAQTLGSVIAALTQIQDLDKALTRAPVQTPKALFRAIFGRSQIKLSEIGLDQIAEEFSTRTRLSRFVSFVLRASGLSYLDQVTAETPMNAIVARYRSLAKSNPKALEERLRPVFGDEWEKVVPDLKAGKTTDDIRFLALSTILDIQPKAASELPRGYLRGGNARIFYMLKTFQIRQLDYIRNEAFAKMSEPGAKNKAVGLMRLVTLMLAMVPMGMSVDALKDWILGRKTSLTDRVLDNILKVAGLSKWTVYKAREEGIGSALMKMILPPAPLLDQAWKDVHTYLNDARTRSGERKKLESVQSIPIVGKPYYWWFGRGAQKTAAKTNVVGRGVRKAGQRGTLKATAKTRKAVYR